MSPISAVPTSDIQDESNMSTPSVSRTSSRLSTKASTDPANRKRKKDDIVEAAYKNLAKEEDEFDAIGTTVAFKLRRMDENQRNIAEYLMNQLLYYGIKNQLEETTYICFPLKPQDNYNSQYNIPPTTSVGPNFVHPGYQSKLIPDTSSVLPNTKNSNENPESELTQYLKF